MPVLCVIKVGAHTEVELTEKKHQDRGRGLGEPGRYREGHCRRGGTALDHAGTVLDDDLGRSGDEATGVRSCGRQSSRPLRWIAENAGLEGYVVVEKVRGFRPSRLDSRDGEYTD